MHLTASVPMIQSARRLSRYISAVLLQVQDLRVVREYSLLSLLVRLFCFVRNMVRSVSLGVGLNDSRKWLGLPMVRLYSTHGLGEKQYSLL